MFQNYTGEIAALAVSICWTISGLFFEKAGYRIGSLSVNIIRLFFATFLLGFTTLIFRGSFFPFDASAHNWLWLGLSGVIGFFLGDLFLFKSYMIIGSRTAALIMSFAPMITAILGWFLLDEKLNPRDIVAILICLTGIIIAISNRKMRLNISARGLIFAFGGAAGQAIGLIMSKKGMGDYNPIAATQIRAIFGLISFALMITLLGRWKNIFSAVKDVHGMKAVSFGSFFGPFIGVTLSLFAIQQTKTGIASTLMALVPILIIWPSAVMFNEKIKPQQIIGAIISVAGATLFFL